LHKTSCKRQFSLYIFFNFLIFIFLRDLFFIDWKIMTGDFSIVNSTKRKQLNIVIYNQKKKKKKKNFKKKKKFILTKKFF